MRAFILAGGLGTRLRPVIGEVPKPMAPVNGKPFLEYLLEWLKKHQIIEVVLCTGYKGETIEAYFGCGKALGLKISYSKEKKPLGTAGALKNARDFFDSPSLVLNGDTFVEYNPRALLEQHHTKSALITVLTIPGKGMDYGRIKVNAGDRVVSFMEKEGFSADHPLFNAGVYAMAPKILDMIPSNQETSLEKNILPRFVQQEKVYAFTVNSTFLDIGTPESYSRAHLVLGKGGHH